MDLAGGQGSMFNDGDPSSHSRLTGETILTDGPGNRGLDFDNDNDFINSGAIDRNDDYCNLWLGTLHVDAADKGNWQFTFDQHDDWYGMWIDLNQDGDFDSTAGGLGSNRGEQLSWNDGGTKTVNLDAGDYMVGFTHLEGGGGSQARVQFQSPTLGRRTIKPTDPAQDGLWRITKSPANNKVIKVGNGTLQISGDNTYQGDTIIKGGTVLPGSNNALGAGVGITIVEAGGTLGLEGGIALAETVALAGNGAADRPAALTNIAGNNSIGDIAPAKGASEFSVGSEQDTLTVTGNVDMKNSNLNVNGDGNVIITGVISGNLNPGSEPPALGGVTDGLEMWFDASDIDGEDDGSAGDPGDGEVVQVWADKSGNDHHATVARDNPVVLSDSLNGLPAVEAVGEEYWNVPGNTFIKTTFSVFRAGNNRTTWDNHGATLNRRSGRGSNWLFENNNTNMHGNQYPQKGWKNGQQLSGSFNLAPINEFMIWTVEVNNNDTGPREYWLGRSDHSQTDIEMAEVIAYNRVLDDGERAEVESYLSAKWGIGLGEGGGAANNDLKKVGDGRLTLTAVNTYAGETIVSGGQLIAASSGALGTADGGTTLIGGGELGLQGGITLAGEALSIPDDATVFSADANQNTLGGSVVASMESNVITLRADSAAGGLVIGGGVDMGGGKLITDGPGDITIVGDIIGASQRRVTETTPNVLNGYAYDVSSGGNGDDNLANIGNPGATPSLLQRDPISHIKIDGNFIIRYDDDNQFINGAGHPSKGFANSLDGLPGLNQNDNYATLFTATLVVPDLNNGQPYTIEFGTHRADDPAYFFLDKNQNGIIESAQGEQVAARGCCGNVFASTSVAPGKYLYIASHLERGGGSQIEPTIDLTPDPHGRRTVRAFDAARPGLFESVQSSIVPADNSLMKMGDGTLRIAGKTVYNGDTTVMAGILEVDGKLREPFRAADLKDDLATITPFTAVADFKDDVAGFSPEVPLADLQDDVAAFDPLELEANYRDGFAGADFPDNWEYLTNVGTNDLASVSTT
ncbi:MAG: autotransporter-associated beta strand repeat-containing protein, partial [Pirellulales bacterium]